MAHSGARATQPTHRRRRKTNPMAHSGARALRRRPAPAPPAPPAPPSYPGQPRGFGEFGDAAKTGNPLAGLPASRFILHVYLRVPGFRGPLSPAAFGPARRETRLTAAPKEQPDH